MTNLSSQLSIHPKSLPKSNSQESIDKIEHKIENITQFASRPYFNKALKRLAKESMQNAEIICNYIIAEQTEINIKQSTKEGKIKILIWLSDFHGGKSFKVMTKSDILDYLNSLRKPLTDDPVQKWIGSYNGRQMILNKFFRWLYNPDEPDQRKRITPTCMHGVKKLPKKEKTPYKHSDIWEAREHAIFLKYCPDKRDQCYHAMANDMSARPHEILGLRISDIKFNMTDNGTQYAEVHIREGKTGPRTVPPIDAIPYLKEWIRDHPAGTNPNSWLFISNAHNSFGQKLTYDGIVHRYTYYYKARFFPKLLEDENVPEADKSFIRNMLTKPWNLYIFRHSSLTEKSQLLPESVLKDHAGWSMSSSMPQIYVHLNGESTKILLEKRGIIKKEDKEASSALHYKVCPNCLEPNKRESKFCTKCKMILSYDAYTNAIEIQQKKEDEMKDMKSQLDRMNDKMNSLFSILANSNDQIEINQTAKLLYQSGIVDLSST